MLVTFNTPGWDDPPHVSPSGASHQCRRDELEPDEEHVQVDPLDPPVLAVRLPDAAEDAEDGEGQREAPYDTDGDELVLARDVDLEVGRDEGAGGHDDGMCVWYTRRDSLSHQMRIWCSMPLFGGIDEMTRHRAPNMF